MSVPTLKTMIAELIATPSASSTLPAMDQPNLPVTELLASWLESLGCRCEILPVAPGKANLLASFGQGPTGLVLAGHSDTVPCDPGQWSSDPLTLSERDGRWYGLGTCDMKAFFALVINALRELKTHPFRRSLLILATCDEESTMAGARTLAVSGRHLGAAAVIGEPTSLRPVRLHKGVMDERIELIGLSGHSSDPALGRSALEAMHAVIGELLALREHWQREYRNPLFHVEYPTMNLGCIHGGDNSNRICGYCSLAFDLRPLPGMDATQLRREIGQRVASVAERYQVDFEHNAVSQPIPAFEQPAASEIVQLAERLTGQAAVSAGFGTEAPFLQRLGSQTLVLGPGDIECAHQPDEHLRLDRVEPCLRLLRGLIGHYCLMPSD